MYLVVLIVFELVDIPEVEEEEEPVVALLGFRFWLRLRRRRRGFSVSTRRRLQRLGSFRREASAAQQLYFTKPKLYDGTSGNVGGHSAVRTLPRRGASSPSIFGFQQLDSV